MSTLASPIADVVRAGLAGKQKSLPPWLFYDAAGSELFEHITELPEYYLTRIERALLLRHADDVMSQSANPCAGSCAGPCAGPCDLEVCELGAGSARKTAHLLRAALGRAAAVQYHPMDISLDAMESAVRHLAEELPALPVRPEVMDFTQAAAAPPRGRAHGQRLMLWLGSSAGNFEPEEAAQILRRVTASMSRGDCLLLGMDLAPEEGGKSMRDLMAAYADAAGVTAEFNRNLLVRLNRELSADFDLDSFAHEARWNAAASRVEMHLVSRSAQRVRLNALEENAREVTFDFAPGETLHTENSYKLSVDRINALLREVGFPLKSLWTDADRWYGLFLGQRQ